ncbi:MAG: hypothetical protein O2966_01935 [Proteobacteria bacterium]|nr:hypothetical protein [Pseudomonadota bacterium]
MYLLQIFLTALIGFSISVNYQDSIAASSGTKSSKSVTRQGHKSHG